jgi:hypothetical protein
LRRGLTFKEIAATLAISRSRRHNSFLLQPGMRQPWREEQSRRGARHADRSVKGDRALGALRSGFKTLSDVMCPRIGPKGLDAATQFSTGPAWTSFKH